MPDENQTSGGTADPAATTDAGTASDDGATATKDDGIKVDPAKSAEQYMVEAEKAYIVPALVREKFADLVKLIYETESMNLEERQYWMQIMPIMTEDQIAKFRDILVNEKEQLSKLDNEYQREMAKMNKPAKVLDEKEMKNKIESIRQAESANEDAEAAEEAALLAQLENME